MREKGYIPTTTTFQIFFSPAPSSLAYLWPMTSSTARLRANNWIPPRSLIHTSAATNIVRITVRIAVSNSEAMSETSKTLGYTIDVAGDSLLKTRDFDVGCAALDGDGSDISGGWSGMHEGDLRMLEKDRINEG